ncbi:hypothetical protein ACO0SA_004753 [Hanseniaspora valbyensis]
MIESPKRCNLQQEKSINGTRSKVNNYWEMAQGVLKMVYDVYRMAKSKSCDVHMSNYGAYFYKYYAEPGNCASAIEEKTIEGAIQAILKDIDNGYAIFMKLKLFN